MIKKVLIPLLILLVALIGIVFYFKSPKLLTKSSDLKIETDFSAAEEYRYQYSVSKKNRDMLQNNDGQTSTGKYAYITNDNKIRWDKPATYKYTPKTEEMFKKITLNGNSITFPISIEDLGEEYREFSKVDLVKLKDMNTVLLKNTKNNYRFLAVYFDGKAKNKNIETDIDPFVSIDVMKDDDYIMNLFWDVNNKTTTRISSGDSYAGIGTADIRVDGIGVGNTFNEMYEKFGTTYAIYVSDDKIEVDYTYEDKSGNYYSILFNHLPKFENDFKSSDFKYIETKPNIITSVRIYCYKAK